MTRSGGYTLVELMVVLVISAIVATGLVQFVAGLGARFAAVHRDRVVLENLSAGVDLLQWDVAAAGTGMPANILGASLLDTAVPELAADLNDLTEFVWRDRNGSGPNGSDELWIGGIGLDLGGTGAKSTLVVDRGAGPAAVTVPRYDAADVDPVFGDPSYVDPLPGEYLSVADPDLGWSSRMGGIGGSPMEIQAVNQPLDPFGVPVPGFLELQAGGGFGPEPAAADDHAHVLAPIRADACDAGSGWFPPWHIQQVRWYLDGGSRTLMRQLIADPRDPAGSAQTPIPVIRDVVDFQVSFLVWRGGDAAPTWIEHLLDNAAGTGEFAAGVGPYNPTAGAYGRADRFLALRERLIAVRVGIVVERHQAAANEDPFNPHFVPGTNQIQLADNVRAGLDPNHRYYVLHRTFDPVNLRIKSPSLVTGEDFPPVRSVALDQATWDAAGGFYSGRNM